MHKLKPNTNYRIINIQIAVPNENDEGWICDYISEMFNNLMTQDDCIIDDWAYSMYDLMEAPIKKTGSFPEEGELF